MTYLVLAQSLLRGQTHGVGQGCSPLKACLGPEDSFQRRLAHRDSKLTLAVGRKPLHMDFLEAA